MLDFMIEDARAIGEDQPVFEARFQQEMLDHWREIQHNRRYPDKREFRPQKFPKFLPQLAIVSVNADNGYDDRLTGATVSEVLRLKGHHDRLVAPPDADIRSVVQSMLGTARSATGPIYFKGRFRPKESASVGFTALVLPFSHNGDADVLDTLMLAFDFSKERRFDFLLPEGTEQADG